MKFVECSKFVKNIYDRENLGDIIDKYHSESNHRAIDKTFLELRDLIYYPNLKQVRAL